MPTHEELFQAKLQRIKDSHRAEVGRTALLVIDMQHGWRSSAAHAALVQTGITYGASAKACSVQEGRLWHDFDVPSVPPIVWIDGWMIPQQTDESDAYLWSEGGENTAALFCV